MAFYFVNKLWSKYCHGSVDNNFNNHTCTYRRFLVILVPRTLTVKGYIAKHKKIK